MREVKIHSAVQLWLEGDRVPVSLRYDLRQRLGALLQEFTPEETKEYNTRRRNLLTPSGAREKAITMLVEFTKQAMPSYIPTKEILEEAIQTIERER